MTPESDNLVDTTKGAGVIRERGGESERNKESMKERDRN